MARTHVIVSDELLSEIDRRVGQRGRSRFLEDAAREKLERLALEEALHSTAGIASGKGYEHWGDRRSTTEWVREGRRTEEAS